MRKRTGVVLFFAAALVTSLPAAQDKPAETKSEVPALTAMHEVIYPMWHTGYQSKDYAALRGLVPELKELASKVYAAQLPAILHEKKAKWDEGVAALKKAVEGYDQAAAGKDDQALLKAAEDVHTLYERLNRIIRPVLPEMDAFHQVLYVVFHTYYPEKKYDGIRGAAADLVAKAEALTKAKLSTRLQAKTEAFQKAAAELLASAQALNEAGKAHDHDGMLKGVDALHAKYQALEKVFE